MIDVQLQKKLVEAVMDYATEHYHEGGWDIVVECWEPGEIVDAIGSSKTERGAIRAVSRKIRPVAEYRREIQNA